MIKYLVVIILTALITFFAVCFIFFNTTNFSLGDHIVYRSIDNNFEFEMIPSKGRGIEMLEQAMRKYEKENDLNSEMQVVRVTKKNYFKISNWCKYKSLPEWNYISQ